LESLFLLVSPFGSTDIADQISVDFCKHSSESGFAQHSRYFLQLRFHFLFEVRASLLLPLRIRNSISLPDERFWDEKLFFFLVFHRNKKNHCQSSKRAKVFNMLRVGVTVLLIPYANTYHSFEFWYEKL